MLKRVLKRPIRWDEKKEQASILLELMAPDDVLAVFKGLISKVPGNECQTRFNIDDAVILMETGFKPPRGALLNAINTIRPVYLKISTLIQTLNEGFYVNQREINMNPDIQAQASLKELLS